MNNEAKEKISLVNLLLSFSLLGFIAIIGIVIWQRGEALHYLSNLFLLEKPLINIPIGVILGIGMTSVVVILAKITRTKLPINKYTKLLKEIMLRPYGPIVVGVLPGVFEEILFRGFLLPIAISLIGTHWAVIVTSFIFFVLHIPQYRNIWIINMSVLVLSIVLSYAFIWTGSLWVAILGHAIYNFSVTYLTKKGYLEFED